MQMVTRVAASRRPPLHYVLQVQLVREREGAQTGPLAGQPAPHRKACRARLGRRPAPWTRPGVRPGQWCRAAAAGQSSISPQTAAIRRQIPAHRGTSRAGKETACLQATCSRLPSPAFCLPCRRSRVRIPSAALEKAEKASFGLLRSCSRLVRLRRRVPHSSQLSAGSRQRRRRRRGSIQRAGRPLLHRSRAVRQRRSADQRARGTGSPPANAPTAASNTGGALGDTRRT
jgi:hypothetical protein